MTIVRLWVIVLIAAGVSWLVLRLLNRPKHFGWVLLFWIAVIFGGTGLVYGLSVWFVSSQ
jgi:thiol:disulfide interchange protein